MSFDLKGIFNIDGRPAKKAVKDVKDDVQKSAEQMSGYLESAFSGNLGGKIFGAAFKAAGLAAVASLASEMASKFQDKLKNIKIGSIRTGLDRETFQRVDNITEETGSSAETAAKGMEHIAIAQEKIKKGEPEAQKLLEGFSALGISLADLDSKSFQEIFFKIAAGMKDAELSGERLAAIHEILGKSGAELIPAFKKGFDSANASAGLITEDDLKNFDSLKKSLEDSNSIWKDMAATVGALALSIAQSFQGIPLLLADAIPKSLGGRGGLYKTADERRKEEEDRQDDERLKSLREEQSEVLRKKDAERSKKQLEERQARLIDEKKQADEQKRLQSENPRLQQQLQERERKNELEKLSPGQRRDALLRELTQAKGDLKLAQENEAENPGNVEAKNARLKLAFRAAGIQGELQGIKQGDSDEGVKDSLARVGGGFQNDSGKMISIMEEVRDSNRQIVDELRDLSNEDNPLSS